MLGVMQHVRKLNASRLHLSAWVQGGSFGESMSAAFSSTAAEAERAKVGRKLLYRSKQRGFLELDLLMGMWAEKSIPTMSMEKLDALSVVLDEENPDLFKWLTGQLPPSEKMASNPAFQAIKADVAHQLASKSPDASRSTDGKEWVRGWDDSWRKPAASST